MEEKSDNFDLGNNNEVKAYNFTSAAVGAASGVALIKTSELLFKSFNSWNKKRKAKKVDFETFQEAVKRDQNTETPVTEC